MAKSIQIVFNNDADFDAIVEDIKEQYTDSDDEGKAEIAENFEIITDTKEGESDIIMVVKNLPGEMLN